MSKTKRGRPPNNKMLFNRPTYLPPLTVEQIQKIEEKLTHYEKIKAEIIKTYKHGQWTPDEHAFNMASLGDELFNEDDVKTIIEDDEKFEGRAKRIRKKAGDKNHIKSNTQKKRVLEINKLLIKQINKSKKIKPHNVAQKIHEQWYLMNPEQRLYGEPLIMQCRGDGGKQVSVRTIERWMKSVV